MVNPTTAMPDAPMSGLANLMAMKGRDNDSMLVHLSPNEVNNLNKLSGNTMTINPATGLPEGRSRFLEAALPALLSIGAGIATGGMSTAAQMAAAAAASGLGAKMTGKSNDEALTSAVLGGATAGLLGGQGSNIAAGGKEAGREIALKAAQDAAEKASQKAITDAAALKGSEAIGNQAAIASAEALKKETADQLARATADLAKNEAGKVTGAELSKVASQTDLAPFKDFVAAPQDVYGNIVADMQNMSAYDALTQTDNLKGLTGIGVREVGGNALVNQMRDDANRPPPPGPEVAEEIDIYSTPFTQTSMGPFNQQQIASNFISGGTAPYGFNYFNQAYGQEGGQVEEMNQGGLTQFQSIMGNPALQIQNPNPPLQMKAGGDLGNYIPSVGIIGGFLDMLNKNKNKKEPTAITNNYYGDPMQMHDIVKRPVAKMFMGGPTKLFDQMINDPKVVELLQGQTQVPPKSYDVLASIGANPPQQMNHGGMTGAGMANSSIIPAIAPLIEVANQQAQQRLAKGGEIVEGLKEIATKKQTSMPAFEGRVKGQGDGMSDDIPFNIEGQQPALLARDEYVIPADVVAMVGNGSSDAGSDKIDGAIANIRQQKYGRAQQPRETEGLGGLLG
jgi:hypothetical protein